MSNDAPKLLEDLKALLKNDIKVKVAGIDVDGVFRGKFISKEKFLSAVKSDGFGFCSVIFGWDIHDRTYTRELLISNKDNGYRDVLAKIDLSTYRRLSWEENSPFFLVTFLDPDTREALPACPRGILSNIVEKAAKRGWDCMAGVELEYFQFKETPHTLAEKKFTSLTPLTTGMHGYSLLRTQLNTGYFHELYDASAAFGIPIEGHHTETGPGVYETALAYTDAARMADNASLFKFLAKSIGMKHGITPSFMAKPYGDLPGCSGHVHVSLRTKDGKNIFALPEDSSKEGRGNAAHKDTQFVSEECEHFLAGVLDGLKDVMPMVVPTINGYKRLVGGAAFWAPNAATWGYDSRSAAIRLLAPPGVPPAATRLEIRVGGADIQPHFALAAIFGLGMQGIERKMKLSRPPMEDPTTCEMLPTSLESATARFVSEGSAARGVLGDAFVEHFGGTREHEVGLWNAAVTSWEVERYLELA